MAVLAVLTVGACARFAAVPAPSPTPGVIPWLDLPPANLYAAEPSPVPSPPITLPADAPPCTAAQLEGLGVPGGGATGHTDLPVLLRNRGGAACWLEGYPDIAVLDLGGHTLAQASGAAGRGTFFGDQPVIRFPMLPGTPALAAYTSVLGQAFLNVEWYDCKQPTAATVVLTLPGGGGRLTVPFNFKASWSAFCDGGGPFSTVERGPFTPAGVTWAPQYLPVRVAVSAPPSARAGALLTYRVSLTNQGDDDYLLDPCPDYTEILKGKQAMAQHQLNCGVVASIAPGRSLTFAMRLPIPSTVPVGASSLTWSLSDPRLGKPYATVPLQVV